MTTFNPPSALTVNASGAYYIAGTQEYKRYSAHALDSATNVYYTLYNVNNTPAAGHAVYFDTSSLQWVDGNTGTSQWPAIIVQPSTLANDDSVEFKKTDGTVIYKFDMRGLVGANTNSNGQSAASGSLTRSGDSVVAYTIDLTSPTASNYVVTHHGITLISGITHTNGAVTSATLSATTYALPKFFGTVALHHGAIELASSLYVAATTTTTTTNKKKVHCNFW